MNPTRGNGLLEAYFASQRRKKAEKIIPDSARKGRILDVGCGAYPVFLSATNFSEKYGVDKHVSSNQNLPGIQIKASDVEEQPLPFDDGYFDAVTMLAVIEHIKPERVPEVLKEVRRVLKQGGTLVVTTPAPWTRIPLNLMAKIRLVSREEIHEHTAYYTTTSIRTQLADAGFDKKTVHAGYFKIFMNIWASAIK
ncbi:Ubiquinone biosynthesis O-methyltransferase [uncultured archaeon]|nr:Ubiquinone biosynthesis O-methyltransferase [uncultured archaeon]